VWRTSAGKELHVCTTANKKTVMRRIVASLLDSPWYWRTGWPLLAQADVRPQSALAGAELTEDNAQAAALKAAADLIAQQRHNNCRLKPAECK
jgi:hypothetical protein